MCESLSDRLAGVEERIRAACVRAGRERPDVRMLAVSKTFGPDRVREAAEAGLTLFGENRVQEAKQKIPLCPGRLEWHMIGHLQRNKVRDAVRLFEMIHSVDSLRLLAAIEDAAAQAGKTIPVCLEVNVSGESSKFGMTPEELPGVLEASTGMMHVDVTGLMTMPPFTEEAQGARPYFVRLRELRDGCREEQGFELPELSMGMSHDFEVAIEEGATWIRLGSVVFGAR